MEIAQLEERLSPQKQKDIKTEVYGIYGDFSRSVTQGMGLGVLADRIEDYQDHVKHMNSEDAVACEFALCFFNALWLRDVDKFKGIASKKNLQQPSKKDELQPA